MLPIIKRGISLEWNDTLKQLLDWSWQGWRCGTSSCPRGIIGRTCGRQTKKNRKSYKVNRTSNSPYLELSLYTRIFNCKRKVGRNALLLLIWSKRKAVTFVRVPSIFPSFNCKSIAPVCLTTFLHRYLGTSIKNIFVSLLQYAQKAFHLWFSPKAIDYMNSRHISNFFMGYRYTVLHFLF